MNENATVAGTRRPTPLDVKSVIAVILQCAGITIRLAEAGNHAIRGEPDGRSGQVRVLGNKGPTRKRFAVKQVDVMGWAKSGSALC